MQAKTPGLRHLFMAPLLSLWATADGATVAVWRVSLCLTIAMQDATALTIATEFTMPGRPLRHLKERIKQPTALALGVEALL
jgi:hypothetical protein